MKREYIEMLWNACGGSETGHLTAEAKSKIPADIWQDWREKQIVADSIVPPEAFLESHDINHPAVIRKDANGQFWAIPDAADETERFRIERSDVELFPIRQNMLAHHIALAWGIKPEFKPAPPKGYFLGYTGEDTAVVMLYERIEPITMQALGVRENLGAGKCIIVVVGDTSLTTAEIEQLLRNGIGLVGTSRFLSEDGKPNWKAAFKKTKPVSLVGTPWEFDEDTDEYKFDGQLLILKPLSKILLSFLLSNFGTVVARETLFNQLYPDDGELKYLDRNLTVQKNILMNALPEAGRPWIQTVRGKGYKIASPAELPPRE